MTGITIPYGVTSIGGMAFSSCKGLTGITIPNSVTSIGGSAFSGCTGLTEITIPSSVAVVNYQAFSGCDNIELITCEFESKPSAWSDTWNSSNLPVYWMYAQNQTASGECGPNLTWELIGDGTLTITGTGAMYDYSWNDSPFYAYKDKITSIILPQGALSIGNNAFSECAALTSVTIPGSVTSIGEYAFSGCRGLTSVTIPNGVISIGSSAFNGCRGLTEISIPESVASVTAEAFRNCSGLTRIEVSPESSAYCSVDGVLFTKDMTELVFYPAAKAGESYEIPSTVTTIGSSAFLSCKALTSVSIPETVTKIGKSAFSGCSGLTAVAIPSGVTSIPQSAFSSCSSLVEVYIPEGITSIGSLAFANCTSLSAMAIPDSVTLIDWQAFDGCSSLAEISISQFSSLTSIGSSAFNNCKGLSRFEIPTKVTSIGSSAFKGCEGLAWMTIPASVTSMGERVFSGCSYLTDIYIYTDYPPQEWNVNWKAECDADVRYMPCPSSHYNTEIRNARPATSAVSGYTGDTYCLDCGLKIQSGEVIDIITDKVLVRPIFDDKIAFEYKFPLPEATAAPTVNIYIDGVLTTTTTATATSDGKWSFICEDILPSQLDSVITAQIEGYDVEIPAYSVKEYCQERLLNSDDSTYKQLISDLLRYGAAAQEYAAGQPSSIADVPGILPALDSDTPYESAFWVPDSSEVWVGATLLLENTITMRLYYQGDNHPEDYNIRCTNPDHSIYGSHIITVNTEKKYVEITGFTPLDYDDVISAEINGEMITYSVGSYINRMSANESSKEITKKIVEALYHYGRSAEAYASRTNQQ